MKKAILAVIIISLILISTLAGVSHFVVAQDSTEVAGLIDSDTTWTLANSPYILTAPVVIKKYVTLTIEAGATVNLSNFSITVDGTLIAKGSADKPIIFNSPNVDSQIVFTNFSGAGCIIENTVISSTIFMNANTFTSEGLNAYHVSPFINNNVIKNIRVNGGEPIISNNIITGKISTSQGQPKFLHNNIVETTFGSFSIGGGAPEISYNTIPCGIIERGIWYTLERTISFNNISGGGIDIDHHGGLVKILNNNVSSSGFGTAVKVIGISSVIVNNTITGRGDVGIYVPDMDSSISGNTIFNCTKGVVIGRDSSIGNNAVTPSPNSGIGKYLVKNNTIANNLVGIFVNSTDSTIEYNNILNNEQNSIFLSNVSSGINAINNWWGITDVQLINQTIYDSKNDFSLGTVSFIPFLTELNPQTPTPSISASPSPSIEASSSPSPNSSPSIPEFPSWIVLPIFTAATLLSIAFIKRKVAKK